MNEIYASNVTLSKLNILYKIIKINSIKKYLNEEEFSIYNFI